MTRIPVDSYDTAIKLINTVYKKEENPGNKKHKKGYCLDGHHESCCNGLDGNTQFYDEQLYENAHGWSPASERCNDPSACPCFSPAFIFHAFAAV